MVGVWNAAVLAICLDVGIGNQVGLGAGDRRELAGAQTGDSLGKREPAIEIRIMSVAAIPRPPARVKRELHEIGEPRLSARSGRLAPGQRTKRLQVDRLCSLRVEVCIEERGMRNFVVGVVVNVLRKILVKVFKFFGIDLVPEAARNLSVLNAAKFVVLDPEVAPEDFAAALATPPISTPMPRWRRPLPWSVAGTVGLALSPSAPPCGSPVEPDGTRTLRRRLVWERQQQCHRRPARCAG